MTYNCNPICFFEVSHGTHNASLVGIREIMIRTLLCGASSIVLVHNHPNGLSLPSKEDIQMTKEIKEVSDLMGIYFCDHIIVGKEGVYSFNEE